jgi:hypothetical protein
MFKNINKNNDYINQTKAVIIPQLINNLASNKAAYSFK